MAPVDHEHEGEAAAERASDPHRWPENSGEKQPNSAGCFVCGLENRFGLAMAFYSMGPGEVEARYTVPKRYEGYPGTVHGGILASMLDEVVGRVAMTEDPDHFLVTAKLELRYREPAPIGQELRLRGRLERNRGRTTVAHGEVVLANGQVAAEATATLVDHPRGEMEPELLEALGWKVYPD